MSTNTFSQKYKILNKIGEGSFSEVLKCKDVRTGEFLAAKRLKKRFESIDEVFGCAEIIAMQKISRHKNILYMKEFHFDPFLGKVTYLFELMDMSLYDFMKIRKRCIPEVRGKNYLFQILNGLAHIHKNGLFHRDIKPENILIKIPLEQTPPFKYEIIKIADLGSIRGIYSRPPYTEYISTRWYRSPECLLTAGYYGLKMDIWATGCVFYEMLTLKPLFPGSNEVDQLNKVHNILGTPSSKLIAKLAVHKSCNCQQFPKQVGTGLLPLLTNISSDGQDILKQMLVYDPDLRSNVKRLLEHRYFINYKDLSDKVLQRGMSFTEPTKTVGDWKGSSYSNIKPTTRKGNDKYVTSANRASQNNVMDLRKYTLSTNFKKSSIGKNINIHEAHDPNKEQLKSTSLQGYLQYIGKDKKQAQSFRDSHKCSLDMFRKTTSNIPQLVTKTSYSPQMYSSMKSFPPQKSLALPRLEQLKALEPLHELPPKKPEFKVQKPQKIMILDSTLKQISKIGSKNKNVKQ